MNIMPAQRAYVPRTFYLNEQHELSHEEKTGGGGLPKLAPIDWAAKARVVSRSLHKTRKSIDQSRDPMRGRRYFMLAAPVDVVRKESKDKAKAPEGVYEERPDYAASEYSRVFQRLGLDLLQVNEDGSATVHALPEYMDHLMSTSATLADLGRREQARWVSIGEFRTIPSYIRLDEEWLRSVSAGAVQDVVIELQPLLARVEIDDVVRAIASYLPQRADEGLTGTGTDFSGRQWYRGRATPRSLRALARDLFSIQSIHAPLRSMAASRRGTTLQRGLPREGRQRAATGTTEVTGLPTVAVVDTGIPADHTRLAGLRRGQYVDPMSAGRVLGDHGCLVTSRVVFGDADSHQEAEAADAACRYYDVNVAVSAEEIEDKAVLRSMEAVVATAPDVRVFNLSFDSRRALSFLSEVERREELLLAQDLDNFVFARDVLVVVAAGNSPPGLMPSVPYPDHQDEPEWGLGHWSRSFNALTCGSSVERLAPNGLVQQLGWPSPFSRVGPGLCDSPKPDFVAHGGNCTSSYGFGPGLGVWACNSRGLWEDHSGTSYSAPILARTAADALQKLEEVCQYGARPFAVTAKAFLVLTAEQRELDERVRALAERALGRGRASAQRLAHPLAKSAVMIWQGVIEGSQDKVPVQLPIPLEWYRSASSPWLRVVVAWDTPANAAAHHVWGCRKVNVRLAPGPEVRAMYPRGRGHPSYPIVDRLYDLRKLPKNVTVDGDMWLLELSYDQIADYYPGIDFSPQQRVAFAAELWDAGEKALSPQRAIQKLPISQTMTRLSVPPAVVRSPVVLRVRG